MMMIRHRATWSAIWGKFSLRNCFLQIFRQRFARNLEHAARASVHRLIADAAARFAFPLLIQGGARAWRASEASTVNHVTISHLSVRLHTCTHCLSVCLRRRHANCRSATKLPRDWRPCPIVICGNDLRSGDRILLSCAFAKAHNNTKRQDMSTFIHQNGRVTDRERERERERERDNINNRQTHATCNQCRC